MPNTNMQDFTILSKIGKLLFLLINLLGTGAFSEVFKVNRKSDGKQYALKKVSKGMNRELELLLFPMYRCVWANSHRRKRIIPSTKFAS